MRVPEASAPALGVVVRAKLEEVGEPGFSLRVCRAEQFDTSERGISIDRLTVPWHRVIEYHWLVTQPFHPESDASKSNIEIRVVVEDATEDGRVHVVQPESFEPGPWTLALVLDRRVLPDHGLETIERLFIPWHRVREYERVNTRVDVRQVPPRPDAEPAHARDGAQ